MLHSYFLPRPIFLEDLPREHSCKRCNVEMSLTEEAQSLLGCTENKSYSSFKAAGAVSRYEIEN